MLSSIKRRPDHFPQNSEHRVSPTASFHSAERRSWQKDACSSPEEMSAQGQSTTHLPLLPARPSRGSRLLREHKHCLHVKLRGGLEPALLKLFLKNYSRSLFQVELAVLERRRCRGAPRAPGTAGGFLTVLEPARPDQGATASVPCVWAASLLCLSGQPLCTHLGDPLYVLTSSVKGCKQD